MEGKFRITESEKLCSTCLEYNKPKKDMCIPVGKIKNPNCTFCSWHKFSEINE